MISWSRSEILIFMKKLVEYLHQKISSSHVQMTSGSTGRPEGGSEMAQQIKKLLFVKIHYSVSIDEKKFKMVFIIITCNTKLFY